MWSPFTHDVQSQFLEYACSTKLALCTFSLRVTSAAPIHFVCRAMLDRSLYGELNSASGSFLDLIPCLDPFVGQSKAPNVGTDPWQREARVLNSDLVRCADEEMVASMGVFPDIPQNLWKQTYAVPRG